MKIIDINVLDPKHTTEIRRIHQEVYGKPMTANLVVISNARETHLYSKPTYDTVTTALGRGLDRSVRSTTVSGSDLGYPGARMGQTFNIAYIG